MFGFSFGEFLLICVVALVAVGPQKLPGLLRTLATWIRKARHMIHDMRTQSGIDEILRAEGLHGGLNELRHLVRTNIPTDLVASAMTPPPPQPVPGIVTPSSEVTLDPAVAPAIAPAVTSPSLYEDLYGGVDIDPTKEYPPEGADSYGALPDDLISDMPAYPLPPSPVAASPEAAETETNPEARSASPAP
ncbi:MAG TPA: hypothetical protein VFQ35_17200 [Polyangiaceae bacterium]|nr:hypothetical protein [Polyangiaceae bacterium]